MRELSEETFDKYNAENILKCLFESYFLHIYVLYLLNEMVGILYEVVTNTLKLHTAEGLPSSTSFHFSILFIPVFVLDRYRLIYDLCMMKSKYTVHIEVCLFSSI